MIRVKTTTRFDPKPVNNYVDRYEARSLNRTGAYGRQTARRSIRKRKRASQPGRPPSSHLGGLRNNIFYSVEGRSVVWGPLDFGDDGVFVPNLLEFGGSYQKNLKDAQERQRRLRATVGNLKRRGRGRRKKLLSREQFKQRARLAREAAQGRKSTLTIEARPFMGPSLEVTVDKFPSLWKAI